MLGDDNEKNMLDELNLNDDEDKELIQEEIDEMEAKAFEEDITGQTVADTSESVTVQPVKFASFEDTTQMSGEANKNLDILMDVKLQLTVELGRAVLPIKKVLELTKGSIIELEKVAGEPVELYANGKLIANGEVVVIEDNFGLRITSITNPDERLKGL
ncbi:flagellar motor switch protein FliN [bacterium]|nr:flagellar motor switch protein FliN [bacterium]